MVQSAAAGAASCGNRSPNPARCKFSRVEFLVEVEVELPPDMDGGRRSALLAAELERGQALATAGVIRAIWRVPGRLANRAIWAAPDATGLHEALTSLPLWPYLDVRVTPLARHAVGPSCAGLPAGLDIGAATDV